MFESAFQKCIQTGDTDGLLEDLQAEEKRWCSLAESFDDSPMNSIYLNRVRDQIKRLKEILSQEAA